MKLQIYSPHPPLKEENVGRGGEKEEDEEKPVTSSSSVCLSVLSKFSNFFLQYKAAALQNNVPRMNTNVLASYTQNIAQGQKNEQTNR